MKAFQKECVIKTAVKQKSEKSAIGLQEFDQNIQGICNKGI